MMPAQVTQELLTRLFRFDLDAGRLYWREPPKNHPRLKGEEAGSPRLGRSGKKYWHVKIGRRAFKRGHLIYFVTNGHWPTPCLDHIDGNSENDSIFNIRTATVTENAWNHKGRAKKSNLPMGVRVVAASGRYSARISLHGQQIHLGVFATADEAHSVYLAKRKELYREFA